MHDRESIMQMGLDEAAQQLNTLEARVAELEAENARLSARLAAYDARPTEPNFAVGDPSIPLDRW